MNQVLARLRSQQEDHLDELFDLLRFPSVSSDSRRKADLNACAEHLRQELKLSGFHDVVLHQTPGHPVLTANWKKRPGAPTVLVYGHYDVQPEDPVDLWDSPPFEPEVRDGRIYARGSMDDKGQLYTHVKALQALIALDALPVNVVLLFEGEEEIGSPNLRTFLQEHKELLKSDCAVISDTNMFAKGQPSITYGLKGLCYIELDVKGPAMDLHSGSYGGPVVNPVNALCELLGSLYDKDGRVAVKGFYDAVVDLSPKEREAFAALSFDEQAFREDLQVSALRPEPGYTALEHLWARPTCDVNGMHGGFIGEGAKTVLPSVANAKLSCRLVPDQDPEQIADLLEAHFRERVPAGIELTVSRHHNGRPVIVPMDHPVIQAGMEALEKAFDLKPVYQREGGSIPIVDDFKEVLAVDTLLMGFGLPEGRCHSPNENFELENFFGGIRAAAWFYHLLPNYMK